MGRDGRGPGPSRYQGLNKRCRAAAGGSGGRWRRLRAVAAAAAFLTRNVMLRLRMNDLDGLIRSRHACSSSRCHLHCYLVGSRHACSSSRCHLHWSYLVGNRQRCSSRLHWSYLVGHSGGRLGGRAFLGA